MESLVDVTIASALDKVKRLEQSGNMDIELGQCNLPKSSLNLRKYQNQYTNLRKNFETLLDIFARLLFQHVKSRRSCPYSEIDDVISYEQVDLVRIQVSIVMFDTDYALDWKVGHVHVPNLMWEMIFCPLPNADFSIFATRENEKARLVASHTSHTTLRKEKQRMNLATTLNRKILRILHEPL